MSYTNRLPDIIEYVSSLFKRSTKLNLTYHNFHHTAEVAKHAKEIAASYNLGEEQDFIILAAAWFHDTGHLFGDAEAHEERSVFVMRQYCITLAIDEALIHSVEQCILATKFPYHPKSLQEEIICDADSYHLGTNEFLITDELMKQEMQLKYNGVINDWDVKTLSMLEAHHFFTAYCKEKLNEGKQHNIETLRNKIHAGI